MKMNQSPSRSCTVPTSKPVAARCRHCCAVECCIYCTVLECRSSLALANQHKFRRIAFPAISCGIYGYPIPDAAKVSIEACQQHVGNLEEICFVLFGQETFDAYSQVAGEKLQAAT